MSLILTSNVLRHPSGWPFHPTTSHKTMEMASLLYANNIGLDLVDGQDLSYSDWIHSIKTKAPKIVLFDAHVAFIQNLQKVKEDLGAVKIIVVCSDEKLIDTLIFSYGVDFVYYSKSLVELVNLLRTASAIFAPFYDHIGGIAYKNGHGEITKTTPPSLPSELVKLKSMFARQRPVLFLPFGYQIDGDIQVDIINGADLKVLDHLDKINQEESWDAAFLQIPSNRKALQKLMELIPKLSDKEKLYMMPSCDVYDDERIYSKMIEAVKVRIRMEKASFFKKFFLNLKLKKYLSI